MSELIKSKEDLISYLTTKQLARGCPPSSVNVSTKLRRSVMTDEMQGRFVIDGRFKSFSFKNMGGGVYEASIKQPQEQGE